MMKGQVMNLLQGVVLRRMSTASSGTPLCPQNIWCVGRNYLEHIKELGNENSAPKEDPMIFLKAGTSAVPSGTIVLPSWSQDVHHEVELAIELGKELQPVRAAVALDLTARDVQAKLKKAQWPWTLAKSFPHSTPLGSAFDCTGIDLQQVELLLEVNGSVRQHGNTDMMMFKIPHLLSYIRRHFPVAPSDVVLTGTPAGVSRLNPGDRVVAKVLHQGKVLSEGAWNVTLEQA